MRLLSQASCRAASTALTTFASRPSATIRKPFWPCVSTVARPKLFISSVIRMRTDGTEPDEHGPVRRLPSAETQQFYDDIPPSSRIYVGNIPFETTEETLAQEFSKFGSIVSVDMPRLGGDQSLKRGIAYVMFESIEEATAARNAMHQQILEGRTMNVQYARETKLNRRFIPRSAPSRTLYIGNLSHEISDQDLTELFRDVKGIMDVRVAIDRRTGKARGFAHADFTTVDHCMEASAKIADMVFHGRRLRCDYSQNTPEKYRDLQTERRRNEGEAREDSSEGQGQDA